MDQLDEKSSFTLEGCWRRIVEKRILIVVSAFLGWALFTGAIWFVPAKYNSQTLILVEQQKVPEHYVEPNIAVDLQQRLQSMSEQILSRTRLMSIIEKFRLYDIDHRTADVDTLVTLMRADIKLDLVKSSDSDHPNQISAFKILYSANSPILAQQVTAELTSLFIEENLRNRQQMSEDTTTFLTTQLDEARKNLDRQEQRLREFKSRYIGQLPEQTTSNLQILAGLQSRLQSATEALHQAQQQRLYLQSLLNNYRMLAPTEASDNGKSTALPSVNELAVQLEKLKSQLADLSSRYTPLHPDIVRLKEQIAATEKLKAKADEDAKAAASAVNSSQNKPVVASDGRAMSPTLQVESQLKANEFEIENRNAEIKNIEKEIDAYQVKLNLTPEREQELAAITRDHDQSRVNYDSLLAKKNQSEMATNLERRQQGEQFRMIDPPSLPQKPYFPNRLMFSLGGLGVGFGVALALIVLGELASPRIYGEQELRAVIDFPLFVTVPALPTQREERRVRHLLVLQGVLASVLFATVSVVTFLIYRRG